MLGSGRFNPDAIVFMKVGYHGDEEIECIIERKRREKERHGFCLWGYGGNVCHPDTQVRPFASSHERVVVCMQQTDSRPQINVPAAVEYRDQVDWKPLPRSMIVTASKYALVLRKLKRSDAQIDLGMYEVAIGPREGMRLDQYVRHRIDKACGRAANRVGESHKPVRLHYVAELVDPYAVRLR